MAVASHRIVMQQKTQRPVQFELTEQTRDSLVAWIQSAGIHSEDYSFPSASPHLSTRPYAHIVRGWIREIGLDGSAYGVLDTMQKVAHVFSHPNSRGVVQPPIEIGVPAARLVMPGFDITQGAFAMTAVYSSPEDQISLGDRTIDGIPAVGTRLKHRIRTGDFGNEQPILVTVEQWFSRDLGVTLEDIQRTTIGGVLNYRLQQIARSEPDPGLFKVPSGYTRKLEHTPALIARVTAPTPKVMMVRPSPPARRFGPVPCPADTPPQVIGCMGATSP